MPPKRIIPLNLALESIKRKHEAGLLDGSASLWERLLGKGSELNRSRRDAATVRYSPEIADHPTNMHEALQRQYHLAGWLKEGGTLEDFIRTFSPER